jgi:glycosyltransferase involved in cell wall biosynthesis
MERMKPVKVVHLITDLKIGGAEMMLYNLLSKTDPTISASSVISMRPDGPLSDQIRSLGVPVISLEMSSNLPNPLKIVKLAQEIKKQAPDILQTWMYHSNLAGSIAGPLAGNIPVVWSIHHSSFTVRDKSLTLFIVRLLSWMSHFSPKKIISCSEAASSIHLDIGYAANKFITIPNGIDTERFCPYETANIQFRQELGVNEDAFLIGNAARFHPQKDHMNLIEAAAIVLSQKNNVHFVLYGENITYENGVLEDALRSRGLKQHFHLLGLRNDVPYITAALDLSVLSSAYGEAFPLVLGEAMASGVPCVATDIGDSAFLIGQTGKIVTPKNPQLLADAIIEFIQMDPLIRKNMGVTARQRILDHFSLGAIREQYVDVYRSLLEI